MSRPGGPLTQQRVRFVAEPMSVPVARRFVTDSMRHSRLTGLLDDAALLVTELSANAALHSGARYFDVVVWSRPQSVRIGVADDGPVETMPMPGHAGTPEATPPVGPGLAATLARESTTGRGLVIVAALADRWGIDRTKDGKLVWGELSLLSGPGGPTTPEAPADENAPDPAALPPPTPPPGWVRVRLVDLPVDLGLRHDHHLQDLVRELQLMGASDAAWSGEIVTLIQRLVRRHSASWRLSQAVVEHGAREGRDTVTLDLVMPRTVVEDVRLLQETLDLSDRLCARHELLTLAAPDGVRRARAWMTDEFTAQITQGREPVPFAESAFADPADSAVPQSGTAGSG